MLQQCKTVLPSTWEDSPLQREWGMGLVGMHLSGIMGMDLSGSMGHARMRVPDSGRVRGAGGRQSTGSTCTVARAARILRRAGYRATQHAMPCGMAWHGVACEITCRLGDRAVWDTKPQGIHVLSAIAPHLRDDGSEPASPIPSTPPPLPPPLPPPMAGVAERVTVGSVSSMSSAAVILFSHHSSASCAFDCWKP